jgi:glycosyltransferase involved in cell wall biosynthesis
VAELAHIQAQRKEAPFHTSHFQVLLIQTGSMERLIAATHAMYEAYPSALCVGWLRAEDLEQARATGLFSHVEVIPSRMDPPRESISDLCILPFEDRFGAGYWSLRNIPLRSGILRIALYNRSRRLRIFSRSGWRANTIVACFFIYPVLLCIRGIQTVWHHIRKYVDVAVLFALAGCALLVQCFSNVSDRGKRKLATGATSNNIQRVVLFIPSLGMGGAQRQLLSYLRHIDRGRWQPEIVTIDTTDTFFVAEFESLGVPVTFFTAEFRLHHVGVVWQLVRYLRGRQCVVLHSWLHYAVALGAIAGGLAGVPIVVGSLRSERPGRFPWFYPKWQRAIDVLTGPLQTTIIANSRAVQEDNRQWALLPKEKLVTIYNGIGTEGLQRLDEAKRKQLKEELQLPPHEAIVGIVGRLSPEKDHATFLAAAERVLQAISKTVFLIVGDGSLRIWVESEIQRRGMTGRVYVLGERKDAKQIIQILDVLVLTSVSEGLPNVLLEGAASGVATVTTAAGGAAEVVVDRETGYVVPCRDGRQVGDRIVDLLKNPQLRKLFGAAAQQRMHACFEPNTIARMIEATYVFEGSRPCKSSALTREGIPS